MSLGLTRAQIALFRSLPPDRQRVMISEMGPAELLALDVYFEMWAHEAQLPPDRDGWRVWLMMAGRGFGKTRAGAEWVHQLALIKPVRIALVAASLDEARSIMVEGTSGILSVARSRRTNVKWEPSLNRLTWPRGSEARLFSGDHADGLRGPEHHFAWADELAKWRQAEAAWDNLQMGLRAGARPRVLVTTTPRPMKLLERLGKDKWTVQTGGRTADNVNLPDSFVDVMMATYGGTRIGRQELDGELIADAEGTLWPRELIEKSRCAAPLYFDRVVIGVDPPAGAGPGCDACGIVVAGRAGDALYVLADESCEGLRPDGWARRVAAAAERWDADRVVAEANNGGAMVADVLRAADDGLPLKLVHASRGKVARAEPVALQFEAGRAFLAGRFPELRGRRGTEWAANGHIAGESFAMIEANALLPIQLPQASLGAMVGIQPRGLGDGSVAPIVSRIAAGEALRPPSPVHLTARLRIDDGLDLSWVRRSRSGWGWLDSVDAPIGETIERYHVRLSGTAGVIELDCPNPSASLTPVQIASVGVGSAAIMVSQIGDFAASREAIRTILLA